jgi:aspartokinase
MPRFDRSFVFNKYKSRGLFHSEAENLETVAVYWESIIKTYGFSITTDLTLVGISFPVDQATAVGSRIRELDATGGSFVMVVGQVFDGARMQLNLLFENGASGFDEKPLEAIVEEEPRFSFRIETPVELIRFHGPHYGDRYGIADAAFSRFEENRLAVLASGCTGASIYIVVPENKARIAVELLSEKFAVPNTQKDGS